MRRLCRWIKENRLLTLNFGMFVGWMLFLPLSIFMGWIYSVAFVSVLSIAALAETARAAWFAELKLMKETRREKE